VASRFRIRADRTRSGRKTFSPPRHRQHVDGGARAPRQRDRASRPARGRSLQAPLQSRAEEPARTGDAHERRRGVRAVRFDVMSEQRALVAPPAASEPPRRQHRSKRHGRAELFARLGIEDICFSRSSYQSSASASGCLCSRVAQIGGRRVVRWVIVRSMFDPQKKDLIGPLPQARPQRQRRASGGA